MLSHEKREPGVAFLVIVLRCRCRHPKKLLSLVFFQVLYIHLFCIQTVMALARLYQYPGSPKPSLFACMISTLFTWASPNFINSPGSDTSFTEPVCTWQDYFWNIFHTYTTLLLHLQTFMLSSENMYDFHADNT